MGNDYRKSSHTTFSRNSKNTTGDNPLWARGYFAVSTGNVSTEMITEYIKHHFENKEDADDPFRVEKPQRGNLFLTSSLQSSLCASVHSG